MTPDFQIVAAGVNITQQIRDRLISLTVTDEIGLTSDTLEIVLDDRDGLIEIPAPGAPIIVFMGYRETGLIPMGLFTSDEITVSAPPATLSIRAKAADLGGGIKGQKTRSWDKTTLGVIADTIAGEHKLASKVAAALRPIKYEHIDQRDESDLNFLIRIARDHDALASVKGGALVLIERGKGVTASGKLMVPTPLYIGDTLDWSMTLATRERYARVTAYWQDRQAAARQEVSAGDGEPSLRLRHPYPTQAEAEAAAKAKLGELTRGKDTLRLTITGNPLVAAEGPILPIGFRLGVDGLWIATSVTHSLSEAGLTTSIEAERAGG